MKLSKRRRQEGRTNFQKRLKLLKGKTLRLVVRKTNKYIILQIIQSKIAQDSVMYSVNSKELLKHGWPENKKNSLKTVTAAYLAGLLLGVKAKKIKERVILDSGLIPNTKGSRVYAAVKGLSDSGIKIPFDDKVIPDNERLEGKHIKLEEEIFNKIKLKILGK
jgi:large subunit ribosomal protein L18